MIQQSINDCKSEKNNQDVKSQVINELHDLKAYKIFGYQNFSFTLAYSQSLQDWSAFYMQLIPEHSMRYLTKKWGDGADFACLLKFRMKENQQKPLKLIKIYHSLLSKSTIAGKYKAHIIKKHIQQTYSIDFGVNLELPLMRILGEHHILLQCVDSEEQQIIVPHNLLNQQNFIYNGLVTFKKSKDGMLRTLTWKKYHEPFDDLQDWNKVSGQSQFQPFLLINNCPLFKQIIKDEVN